MEILRLFWGAESPQQFIQWSLISLKYKKCLKMLPNNIAKILFNVNLSISSVRIAREKLDIFCDIADL